MINHRSRLLWLPLVLCVVLWVAPVVAQEQASDGRPEELQPDPVVPENTPGAPALAAGGQDTDSAMVGAEGDISVQDQVINDDLIVVGGECVGIDCASGESFDFVTIRLKENSTRIYFQDTSSTSEFPSNDWTLVANDSGSGGLNRFSIYNVDGGRTPFSVLAGSPENALYVQGESGSSTINAAVGISEVPASGINLHVADGWTPYIRLQLTERQGWARYAWDVFANESNFVVRDVDGGGTMPFRIFPGAPTDSLSVGGAGRGDRPGYIGFGTSSPEAALHVAQPSTSWREPGILVEGNSGAAEASRTMLDMVNKRSRGSLPRPCERRCLDLALRRERHDRHILRHGSAYRARSLHARTKRQLDHRRRVGRELRCQSQDEFRAGGL